MTVATTKMHVVVTDLSLSLSGAETSESVSLKKHAPYKAHY